MGEGEATVAIPDPETEREKFGPLERAFSSRAKSLIGLMGAVVRLAGRTSAGEWLKMLAAVGVEYEVGRVEKDRVEVFLLKCPFGLTEANGRPACDAGMATDRGVVRGLGGELEIGETIATGADKCHLVIKTAKSSA